MREKQFVRTLSPAELQRVRSQVRQITCSECGAPIDLEHSSECKYCHAPVSFLDADAVQKGIELWSAAENRRHLVPTPEAVGNALLALRLHNGQEPAATAGGLTDRIFMNGIKGPDIGPRVGLDLVAAGIHAVGRLFNALD